MSYAKPLGHVKPENETADERDARMDAAFVGLDREEFAAEGMTVLAVVSAFRHDLADEFLRWWSVQREPRERIEAALVSWEIGRFGAPLFNSAHGLLVVVAKEHAFGSWKRPPQPKLTPGLTNQQRRDRMLSALDQVAQDKRMPKVGTSMDDLA